MKKSILCVALCVLLMLSNLAAVDVSAEDNYVDNWEYLNVGTAEYTTDTSVAYTVYHFEPEEVGKYTISCTEQAIALAGYNWVTVPLSAETVNAHSFEWNCTAVGQGICVAMESGDGAVEITVTREDLVQKEEVPWVIYENKAAPTAFTFALDSSVLKVVNTADTVVDKAVLGADGYYHLNTADGAILFAKLTDSTISLKAMIDYGQIKEVVQDADNNILSRTDYNNAVNEYVACMDSKTGLYPLTVDLMEVYQRVGKSKNWYGTGGYVGGDLEDAWMFACYYVDGFNAFESPEGDVNSDGKFDVADATAVFFYLNGAAELANADAADVNADGVVNLFDAVRLFYIANGLAE